MSFMRACYVCIELAGAVAYFVNSSAFYLKTWKIADI